MMRTTLDRLAAVTIVLLVSWDWSSGAGLKEPCYNTAECPSNSVCKARACDMFICQCQVGYHHFSPSNTCVKVSLIGEACSSNSRCLPINALCNTTSGVCECKKDFTPSRDGFQCRDDTFGKKPDLDDPCTASLHCDFFSECVNSSCECKPGFHRWSEEEKWLLYPRPTFLSCKTPDLAIDMCNGVKISSPQTPHHQTAPNPDTITTATDFNLTVSTNGSRPEMTSTQTPPAKPVFIPGTPRYGARP